MKMRGIAEREVIEVLQSPTKKNLPTDPDRERWRRGRIDVVFERWKEKFCIITTFRVPK